MGSCDKFPNRGWERGITQLRPMKNRVLKSSYSSRINENSYK